MPPIIRCVRHGQGFHNVPPGFYNLPDPKLTPEGEEQCSTLRTSHFPGDQSKISLITASPLSRTLHTAWLIFQPALESSKHLQILAIPDAQETSDEPCDTGSGLADLELLVKSQNWPVDLSLLTPDWNIKGMTTRYSPHSDAIKARALSARRLIREKARQFVKDGNEAAEIVLVSHGGYLHYFTGDWESAATRPGTGWMNCETRTYGFEDLSGDDGDDAKLVERMESRRARGLNTPMAGTEEQKKLFEEAMEGWEQQGLQRPDRMEIPQATTAKTEIEKVGGPELARHESQRRVLQIALMKQGCGNMKT